MFGLVWGRQEDQDNKDKDRYDRAIAKGLKYLASKQSKKGYWKSAPYQNMDSYIVETALCGLAFLACGDTTTSGKYKKVLKKAVSYLTKYVKKRAKKKGGRIGPKDGETWRVTFMILFLSEVYRKDKSKGLKKILVALKNRLIKLQRKTGGWCHDLRPSVRRMGHGTAYYTEDPVAATNFAVIAISALNAIGIEVLDRTIKKVNKYYKKAKNKDGGFKYGFETGLETGAQIFKKVRARTNQWCYKCFTPARK
jgi:prenyltransferase beta subunit